VVQAVARHSFPKKIIFISVILALFGEGREYVEFN
jgi:hypothetical protein